jgi:hypothetical protein
MQLPKSARFDLPDAPSIEDILGIAGLSIDTELARIRELLAAVHDNRDRERYSWALSATNYSCSADAHLQFQLLSFLAIARKQLPGFAENVTNAIEVGCLDSRNYSLWIKHAEDHTTIGVPIVFVKGINEFYRAHFELKKLGAMCPVKASPLEQATNFIGGQDIETAIKLEPQRSWLRLGQMVGVFSASDLFEITSLIPDEFRDQEDIYAPELIASLDSLFKEFGVTTDPCLRLPLTAEVRGATYLTIAFALCHEICHELNGDKARVGDVVKLGDDASNTDQELAADYLALALYTSFVLSVALHKDLSQIVDSIPGSCRFSLGPSGFFAAATSIWLGKLIFDFPKGPQTTMDQQKAVEYFKNLEEIGVRRSFLNDSMLKFANMVGSDGQEQEARMFKGVLAETYAVEFALQEMKDRMWKT